MEFNLKIGRDDAIIVYRILLQHAAGLEQAQASCEADGQSHVEICPRAVALIDVAMNIYGALANADLA